MFVTKVSLTTECVCATFVVVFILLVAVEMIVVKDVCVSVIASVIA